MDSENYMILTFLIVFILALLTYYHYIIKPKEDKKKDNEKIMKKFLSEEKLWKNKKNKDSSDLDPLTDMKDLTASKLKFLEYQNFLPGEGDIKLEDSFSDAYQIPKSKYEQLVDSSVPTLNTYQCWLSKEFECPTKNGSFLQCTNNYIPQPDEKNCDCSNRTFEMCPFPYKISENKYYKEIGFDREKKYGKLVI